MAVTTTKTNKPINPRGNDQSPKGYNRAELYSGKALDFDGVNDVLTTANNLPFSSGDDLSIVSYFKIDDSNEGYFYQNAAIYLAVYRDGSTSVGELSGFVSGSWLDTGYIVNDSKWYQVAQIVDNGTQRIYLNGQEIATQSGVSYNPGSQTVLNIGKRDSNYLNGQMANIKAFNVALTAAQVADLYNNPEKIVPTGVADSALKLWLPMMEGAGTTAYDGSGNGNHGTISGATWTHGIGAPVAQTAVIDWNKGTNLVKYSEELDRGSYWGKTNTLVTANDTTAPDGQDNAELLKETTATGPHYINTAVNTAASTTYVQSVWVKKKDDGIYAGIRTNGVGSNSYIIFDFDTATIVATGSDIISKGVETYSNGWYRIYMTYTLAPTGAIYSVTNSSSSVIPSYAGTGKGYYIWGAQVEAADSLGAYIPNHTVTPITSDVLLPQGLTTGRDITGVNLFENVRKQGALNLDGNSWAEVHDNASLDITDAITLEAWVYWDTDGATGKGILGRWISGDRTYLLYKGTSQNLAFYINSNSTSINTMATGWHHIVGTYDKSNLRLYVDGSQENSASLTIAIPTSGRALEIGRHEYSTSKIYDQSIAQPRIYNRALTAEEIERNFTAGKYTYNND